MLEIVNGETPLFVSVTTWGRLVVSRFWAGKVRLAGARLTAGPVSEVTPGPLRATVCGLPAALSVMVNVPIRVPIWLGLKVTLIAQVEPGLRVAGEIGQVFPGTGSVKFAAFAPDRLTLLMVKFAPPEFVTVSVCARLMVPTTWALKERLVVERVTAGASRTSRMRLLSVSAMKRWLEPSTATPYGKDKLAVVAGPPSPVKP